MATPIAPLESVNLRALCDILGATESGLTGTEIGRYLAECRIGDPEPQITKRHRLFSALSGQQASDGHATTVLRFVKLVMSPVRHVGNASYFETKRGELNAVLAFSGLRIEQDGKLVRVTVARTLSEAEAAASAIRKVLIERKVHPDVLAFCRAELVTDNYFHAVFEATKSVAEKLRQKSGHTSDGTKLVDEALGTAQGLPILAFNSLRTDSERSEHTGLMNLLKGIFGAFRNTAAHAPRIHWKVDEQDALDILTTLSLIHRRLDRAVPTQRP